MLTKSDLQSFLQCPKRLWLEKNGVGTPRDEDPAQDRRRYEGQKVGQAVRKLYQDKGLITPLEGENKKAAADRAKDQITGDGAGCPAAEVPFFFEDLYARADIVYPEGSGYVLQETKSRSFPLKTDKVTPGKPDQEHVVDLAIQAYAMKNMGWPLVRSELNLIDNRWKYPGGGDYSGLFRTLDVTKEVDKVLEEGFEAAPGGVEQWFTIRELFDRTNSVVVGPMPTNCTGKHCSDPHDCPFMSWCETQDPPKTEHPIELLPGSAGKALAKKLKAEYGYESLLECDPLNDFNDAKEKDLYVRMQFAHETGETVLEQGSNVELDALPYPRYYLDFEGIDLAIPQWAGVRPYEQIPFQFSCHIETAPGVFELKDFLDMSGKDPSIPCIEGMKDAIKDDGGPIFVYHAPYEKGRLQELALRHPEYKDFLHGLVGRLVDLLPLVKKYFYHPSMEGSFSIKKVLPVIAPDLSYDKLVDIQDGVAAQKVYIQVALKPEECTAQDIADFERNALTYCRQDTWAMVEVAYFLARKEKPVRGSEVLEVTMVKEEDLLPELVEDL